MSEGQNKVYIAFVMWITTMISGIGLEFFFWVKYVLQNRWSSEHEYWWRLSQFLFPLLLLTALRLVVTQNYLALSLLVIGLWKFGFPETLMYLYLGAYGYQSSRLCRWSDLLNRIGSMLHHSGVAFAYCTLSRYPINPCLILIMQHWCALVQYWNGTAYILVELFLEAWFQWNIISEFWYFYQISWMCGLAAGVMFVAHWIYLVAPSLSLIAKDGEDTEAVYNVHVRGTNAFCRIKKRSYQEDESETANADVETQSISEHHALSLYDVSGGLTTSHSGSGKTTLLKALGGRESNKGEVYFGGKLISPNSPGSSKKVAFVSDHEMLEPPATCYEAIRFSARLRLPASFTDDEIDTITRQIMKELKLEKCTNVFCEFLSTGERRRSHYGSRACCATRSCHSR